MAQSFLDKLLGALGSSISGIADDATAIGQGMYDETFNPYREEILPFAENSSSTGGTGVINPNRRPLTTEDIQNDGAALAQRMQFLLNATQAPVRMIDRASERYLGAPLFSSSPEPLNSPVSPGASPGEERLAATKMMEMVANRERKMDEIKAREQQAFAEFNKAALAKESSPDTLSFAAIGDNVAGDEVPGSKGQFSRAKGQSEESRAIAKLVKEGVPAAMAPAIYSLSRAKTEPQAKAAELQAALASPKEKGAELQNLVTAAMKSADPLAAMRLVKVALRLRGVDDDTIEALFKQAEK